MGYDVDPTAYGRSADKMVALGAELLKSGGLSPAISAQSGMAGSDDAARAFADGYDKAAPQALTAMNNVASTSFSAAQLLWATGDNYAEADAASTPGGGDKNYAFVEPESNESWPLNSPSVLGGGGDDGPGGAAGEVWKMVEGLVGHVWPNGHQDRLRSTADAWAVAATHMNSHSPEIASVTGLLGAQQSPEIPVAIARIKAVGDDLEAISKACAELGRCCNEYAQHIDDAHSELISELEEFAVVAAIGEGAGVLLTEVAGELWVNGLLAGRLAALGERLKTIIEGFIGLVRAVGAKVGRLLTDLAAIVARTGAKIIPGTSRVGQPLIEDTLQGFLKKAVTDYETGALPASERQMNQLLSNPDKWENVVKGNVIDDAMKKAVENDPFLREHLTVTPRFQRGPDIIVTNPAAGAPSWYDVTTTRMGDAHLQRYADWGVGKILAWDQV